MSGNKEMLSVGYDTFDRINYGKLTDTKKSMVVKIQISEEFGDVSLNAGYYTIEKLRAILHRLEEINAKNNNTIKSSKQKEWNANHSKSKDTKADVDTQFHIQQLFEDEWSIFTTTQKHTN